MNTAEHMIRHPRARRRPVVDRRLGTLATFSTRWRTRRQHRPPTSAVCMVFAGVFVAWSAGLCAAQVIGPSEIIALDLPILAAGDARPLLPLAEGVATLPTACQTCSLAKTQFAIWIPEGATRLALAVECIAPSVLSLAVRKSEPVLEDADYVYLTYSSGPELTLPLAGEADLAPGIYYAAILGASSEIDVAYTLLGAAYVASLPQGVSMSVSHPVLFPAGEYADPAGTFRVSYPVGWVEVPSPNLHPNVRAAFETPATSTASSSGLLEIGSWDMTVLRTAREVFDLLAQAYTEGNLFALEGQPQEASLDRMPAVAAFFSGSPLSALLACAVDGPHVWLITLTFRPIEALALYESAFLMAVESFRRTP